MLQGVLEVVAVKKVEVVEEDAATELKVKVSLLMVSADQPYHRGHVLHSVIIGVSGPPNSMVICRAQMSPAGASPGGKSDIPS